jgi:hypothetical protein
MSRTITVFAVLLCVAACDRASQPEPATTQGLLELVTSNATVVGYLYAVETPSIRASFSNGVLQWRAEETPNTIMQGKSRVYSWPDRTCIGFEQKNVSMPSRGPERYLVCEAVRLIAHSNASPRSQDFRLASGTLFLQYDPPAGTGFTQIYYASRSK